jgi:hypothetical protein
MLPTASHKMKNKTKKRDRMREARATETSTAAIFGACFEGE